jgi:hypothetical protein
MRVALSETPPYDMVATNKEGTFVLLCPRNAHARSHLTDVMLWNITGKKPASYQISRARYQHITYIISM